MGRSVSTMLSTKIKSITGNANNKPTNGLIYQNTKRSCYHYIFELAAKRCHDTGKQRFRPFERYRRNQLKRRFVSDISTCKEQNLSQEWFSNTFCSSSKNLFGKEIILRAFPLLARCRSITLKWKDHHHWREGSVGCLWMGYTRNNQIN